MMRGFFAAVFLVGLATAGSAGAATPKLLPARVHVAGVKVGGLNSAAATRAVEQAFASPLTVRVDKRTFELRPARLAAAYVEGAIRRAAVAAPGTRVPLVVAVRGAVVREIVSRVARKVEHRAATGALALHLRDGKPYVAPNAYGRELDTANVLQHVVHELATNQRAPLRFATKTTQPRALASLSASIVVINRATNLLSLYRGTGLWRQFHVATGQAAYPTPAGRFDIVVKWKNPWWYPPPDPWAAGEQPTPPGPSNPLGTRWMGISSPGVGIHGTPEPQSIGYSESHGCIRMLIPQAEWLFDHVDVGTTVFIT
jgi:lipoprotein-anchoring transpeptidase ErfK/SrfK